MNITKSMLLQWGACYCGRDASDTQREIAASIPSEGVPLSAIVSCDLVPWRDRVWVAARADVGLVRRWALWCAAYAHRHYRARYPHDQRVRDCLRVTGRYIRGRATLAELHRAQHAAADAYADAYAYAADAAYAAAYAAAYVAYAYAAYAAREQTRKRCIDRLVSMVRKAET